MDVRKEPSISDVIRPLSDEPITRDKKLEPEDVPEFVTRDTIQPLAHPLSSLETEIKPSKTSGWIILGFGVLYIIGASLYFGLPLLSQSFALMSAAGLILLLALPLILLFLLWRTLRHLGLVSLQNLRLTKAADALISPDQAALERTENLATGIRAQISKVNSDLADTVDAMKDMQAVVARESQALDAAGTVLTSRSDEVGRNLTLQRQALESMSGTFDTRMNTLSTQITDSSQALDGICTAAETKLLSAGEALEKATAVIDETISASAERIDAKVTSLEDTNLKLTETTTALTSDLSQSTEVLLTSDASFVEQSEKLRAINDETQTHLTDLQTTIGHGYEMLEDLREAAKARNSEVASHYEALSNQIKHSEDNTLAAQGQTARMVESNLAQMRRDFSRMETDLKGLQAKLSNLRNASDDIADVEPKPTRLNLKPLESDFPPVEPSRPVVRPERVKFSDMPLNLGADMEIESPDAPLTNFQPDVIRRPGEPSPKPKSKGFGRRSDKDEKSGWKWRDMLGTLERADTVTDFAAPVLPADETSRRNGVDGVALLTALQLSPAAIVDEGTVVDATQARINNGEPGLTKVVAERLPEAVAHLKDNLEADTGLKSDLRAFTADFSNMIGNTPPTAPALRAAFGSPEGRAYLLCAAAFRPELRA